MPVAALTAQGRGGNSSHRTALALKLRPRSNVLPARVVGAERSEGAHRRVTSAPRLTAATSSRFVSSSDRGKSYARPGEYRNVDRNVTHDAHVEASSRLGGESEPPHRFVATEEPMQLTPRARLVARDEDNPTAAQPGGSVRLVAKGRVEATRNASRMRPLQLRPGTGEQKRPGLSAVKRNSRTFTPKDRMATSARSQRFAEDDSKRSESPKESIGRAAGQTTKLVPRDRSTSSAAAAAPASASRTMQSKAAQLRSVSGRQDAARSAPRRGRERSSSIRRHQRAREEALHARQRETSLRTEVSEIRREKEEFQREMEEMMTTAQEQRTIEEALQKKADQHQLQLDEVKSRQHNLHQQKSELERRRDEVRELEESIKQEEESLQASALELAHQAKEQAEKTEVLRREKKAFQMRSAEMLKKQEVREKREQELRRLMQEVEEVVNPQSQSLHRARRPSPLQRRRRMPEDNADREVARASSPPIPRKRQKTEEEEEGEEETLTARRDSRGLAADGRHRAGEPPDREAHRSSKMPEERQTQKAAGADAKLGRLTGPNVKGEPEASPEDPNGPSLDEIEEGRRLEEAEQLLGLEEEALLEGEEEATVDFVEDGFYEDYEAAAASPTEPKPQTQETAADSNSVAQETAVAVRSEEPAAPPRPEEVAKEKRHARLPVKVEQLDEAPAVSGGDKDSDRWQMMSRSPSRQRAAEPSPGPPAVEVEDAKERHRKHVEKRREEVKAGQRTGDEDRREQKHRRGAPRESRHQEEAARAAAAAATLTATSGQKRCKCEEEDPSIQRKRKHRETEDTHRDAGGSDDQRKPLQRRRPADEPGMTATKVDKEELERHTSERAGRQESIRERGQEKDRKERKDRKDQKDGRKDDAQQHRESSRRESDRRASPVRRGPKAAAGGRGTPAEEAKANRRPVERDRRKDAVVESPRARGRDRDRDRDRDRQRSHQQR